jgi:hypothetical protein
MRRGNWEHKYKGQKKKNDIERRVAPAISLSLFPLSGSCDSTFSVYFLCSCFSFLPHDVRAITFLRRKWCFCLDLLYCVKHPYWLTTLFFLLFLCRICLWSISTHTGWSPSFIVVFRVGGRRGMFTCLDLAHMLQSPCSDLIHMLRFICSSTSIRPSLSPFLS